MSVPWMVVFQFWPGRDDLVPRPDAGGQILRLRHPLADRVDVVRLQPRRLAHAHADPAAAKVPGADHDHVRAGGPDLGLDLLLCAPAEGDHRDDGGNPDDHAQHGQAGSHLVAAERLERDPKHHQHGHRSDLVSRYAVWGTDAADAASALSGGRAANSSLATRRDAFGRSGEDPAVVEADDPVAVLGDVRLVRDQQHRDAALLIQTLEDVHHLDAGARVQVAGRLVRQEDGGLVDQGAGNRHPLLLAARELVREVIHPVVEPDRVQHLASPRVTRRSVHAGAVEQGELDVVEGGGPRQQVEALEHEADLPVAHLGQLVAREPGDIPAVEQVVAAGRPVEAAEDVHERRLAGPGRSGDRDELAGLDGEAHAPERTHLDVAHGVDLGDVLDRDDRFRGSHRRPRLPKGNWGISGDPLPPAAGPLPASGVLTFVTRRAPAPIVPGAA